MAFNIDNRPDSFESIVGNKDIIESLQSLLAQKKPPHTFLFYGMTGCGKTTFARILAKMLGCSEYDLSEVNASNNRGIDTARDILQQMHYKPLSGQTKVYILDEVHQATKDFQNGILKALEDAPEHVYFILCTTKPEKLLKTVRNRCSSFQLSKLNLKAIQRLLNNILNVEKKKVSDAVIEQIATESEGIPRQALIMLQQVIDIKDEEKAIKIIKSIKTDEKQIIDLCQALITGKSWDIVASIVKKIEAEPESVRRAVLGYFSACALNSRDMKSAKRFMIVIESFSQNYYDNGKAGLIMSCFDSIFEKN